MIWFYVTIFAVIFQTYRNSLQKRLKEKISTIAVSWARILFLFPLLLALIGYLYQSYAQVFSGLSMSFYIFCFFAGLAQILGTLCLVELFSLRSFSVGVAYMKTDTIQVAILAFLFLNESLHVMAIFAILLGVIGILLLTPQIIGSFSFSKLFHKSALLGLGVGLFLSLTTIFMKKAMLSVPTQSQILPMVMVFTIYVLMQNVIYVGYLFYKKRLAATLNEIITHNRTCIAISVFSMLGTICWLQAFFLQNVAYVKTVAQLEIFISLIVSNKIFKEQTRMAELFGMLLLTASILLLILH